MNKEKLYENYITTHLKRRKGDISLENLKERISLWEATLGRFIPVDREAVILDLGCGYGSIVWWLQQKGYRWSYGVDISKEEIARGIELGINNIVQTDIKKFLEDKEDSYDLIILRDVAEHFTMPEVLELLVAIRKSLKIGGKLFLQVPNAESPFFGRIRYGDITHETAFCISSLMQFFSITGYSRYCFYSVDPVVTGLKSFLRSQLWKFIKLAYQFLLFVELGQGSRIVSQNIIAVAINESKDYNE